MPYKQICTNPKCKYEWMSWVPHPKECPKCHYYLHREPKKYFCEKCKQKHLNSSGIGKEHLRYKKEVVDK